MPIVIDGPIVQADYIKEIKEALKPFFLAIVNVAPDVPALVK